MEAPKPEEISHLPMDQLQGLEYCIDSNPSWGMFISIIFSHSSIKLKFFLLGIFIIKQLILFLLYVRIGEAIALGFQHYILALGTAVMIPSFLVPLMGGDHVSSFN